MHICNIFLKYKLIVIKIKQINKIVKCEILIRYQLQDINKA